MPSKGGRRLPPDPPSSSSDAPPPPLPSRPNMRPPPPKSSVCVNSDPECSDSSTDDDAAPALPPRNFSPSPEEGETYEIPDFNQAPPPGRGKPPPITPPPANDQSQMDGELYDELDGIAPGETQSNVTIAKPSLPPPPQSMEGEIYDQCDIQAQDATTGGEIYEDPNDDPPPNDGGGGEIYEVPEETSLPKPPSQRREVPQPPPVAPQPPSTNTMPAPVPSRSTTGQKQILKKLSGEGATGLGISQDMIGNSKARLRKVSVDPGEPDRTSSSGTDQVTEEGSVKDKISLFKAAETDDNDGESNPNSLKNQLNMARYSLKKRSPVKNTTERSPLKNATDNNLYFSKSNTPENKPTMADTSKLSIQQRIAMMHGQKIDATPITASVSPSPRSKPTPGPPKPALRNNNTQQQAAKVLSKPVLPTKPTGQKNLMPNTGQMRKLSDTRSPTSPQVPSVPPPSRTVQPSPPPYQEEIYDDAINVIHKDPLESEVWYHGLRDRKECEEDITKNGQDGSYLVRKSAKGGDSQPYTLVVLYKGHVYNLRIRKRDDDKIALGNEKELEQELAFDSVPELISHHTTNEVILINQRENKQYRAFLKNPLQST